MRIQNNIQAMNTHRQLGVNQSNQAKSTEKLSSGYRINRAGDDAAGLSISEKMRAQIRGLDRASSNAQDGVSMIQAAEGALQETHSILQRMRELAVQGANDVNATEDRGAIKSELDQMALELDRIATSTNFNGKYLLSGAYSAADSGNIPPELAEADPAVEYVGALNIQVGSNTLGSDVIKLNITGVTALDLLTDDIWTVPGDVTAIAKDGSEGMNPQTPSSGDLGSGGSAVNDTTGEITTAGFQAIVNVIDGKKADGTAVDATSEQRTGIDLVNELRSTLGAMQNRLEHTIANVDTISENIQSAESRIRDVDMAKEMMSFTTSNVLNQAATAMLAQANQLPQNVLSLIR